MIGCPTCGAAMECRETETLAAHVVKRRRVCSKARCAQRVITIELIVPEAHVGQLKDLVLVPAAALTPLLAAARAALGAAPLAALIAKLDEDA